MGHRRAFDFVPGYEAATGIEQYLSGTPGILGMSALEEALSVFDGLDIERVREKSIALTEAFMTGVSESPELASFRCLTPSNPALRGSQVSLAHEHAYAIAQALIDQGVIVDFRAPDIVRFGFAPLYNSFADVARALATLANVMAGQRYRESRFTQRARVT
jgi:kynureninase